MGGEGGPESLEIRENMVDKVIWRLESFEGVSRVKFSHRTMMRNSHGHR